MCCPVHPSLPHRYKEAIDFYTRGLQVDPDNHVIHSNRSAAFLKENERGKVGAWVCCVVGSSTGPSLMFVCACDEWPAAQRLWMR